MSMRYNRLFWSILATLTAFSAHAQSPSGDAASIPITVAKPTRQDVPVMLQGLGVVSALNNVVLHPRVDGTLDRVNFVEGTMVKAGDLLAQLDPRPYQALLDAALAKKAADSASLANAKRDLDRYSQLAANQYAAQQQVDTQRSLVAQLDAANHSDDAAIAAAQLNVDFTRITAPFDGRVGLRLSDPGSFIRAADATNPGIVAVSQIQPISVTFSLPQDKLPAIASAMAQGKPKVSANSADDKATLADGTLLTIDNSIDATTGTIKVKAIFPNQDLKLWPGQFVNARLQVAVQSNALTLPSAAIQHGPNGLFVYQVKPDNTVSIASVDVALDNGSVAAISTGVADGDIVVLSGHSRLRPGAKVSYPGSNGS